MLGIVNAVPRVGVEPTSVTFGIPVFVPPVTTVFFVTLVTTVFFEIFGMVKAVPSVGSVPWLNVSTPFFVVVERPCVCVFKLNADLRSVMKCDKPFESMYFAMYFSFR